MAADALQAIAIYDVGGGTVEAVTRRLAGQPVRLDVAAAVAPFLVENASSELDIVYPQLGGLTDSASSMMVVVRHRTLVGDRSDERRGGKECDSTVGSRWAPFTEKKQQKK